MGLINLIRNGGSVLNFLTYLLSSAIVILVTLPMHEYAHAFVASKLGDRTAKYQGRLTLNPIKHLDPLGSALILLVGFGWAKPVPVNMNNFKNPKRDMAITAIAGPITNFLLAIIAIFLQFVVLKADPTVPDVIFNFFEYFAYINIFLAVFNLIPIPPLDGSRVLTALLPNRYYYILMNLERYSMIIIYVLMIIPTFSSGISTIVFDIYKAIVALFSVPFGHIIFFS